jgi:hypothetical protein
MILRNVLVVLVFLLAVPGCLADRLSHDQIRANAQSDDGAVDDAVDTDDGATDAAGTDAVAEEDVGDDEVDSEVQADIATDTVDPDTQDGHDTAGTDCETNWDCQDQIKGKTPCILAICDNGYCVKSQKAAGTVCMDSSQLPVPACHALSCDLAGQCLPTKVPNGTVCGFGVCGNKCVSGDCVPATSADYDDGNPCTEDRCNQFKEIVHNPVTDLTVICNDQDACTTNDACIQGKCTGQGIDCTDGVDCTADGCGPSTGCSHAADATLCDDGNPCTVQACDIANGCVIMGFDATATCDDGNTCTADDLCTETGGCAGSPICECQDDSDCVGKNENLCLGAQKCVAGTCAVDPNLTLACNSENDTVCVQNTCDPATGNCQPKPRNEGKPCDDGDACTSSSACAVGVCVGAETTACDDGNPCTSDACVPQAGCAFTPTTSPCNDGNTCTTQDQCLNGGCIGNLKSCDDGVACTLDGCDAASGQCSHAVDSSVCDDKNPCTKDSCNLKTGCAQTADNAAVCDDGETCTTDSCKGGQCVSANSCPCLVATAAQDCNDNNPCTVDTCDTVNKKCVNDPVAATGQACTPSDKCKVVGSGSCSAGVCGGGTAKDCSSTGNLCNTGTCNATTGACVAVPKLDGTACDADANACTTNDSCKTGKCTAGPVKTCPGDTCNLGTCTPVTGACGLKAKADATPCNDANVCTAVDLCGGGSCVGGAPPACDDLAKNGAETDVDCGGTAVCGAKACQACAEGDGCKVASDCVTLRCVLGKCATPTCSDGVKNGTEEGADCGGPCVMCPSLFLVAGGPDSFAARLIAGGTWQKSNLGVPSTDGVSVAMLGVAGAGTAVAVLRYSKSSDPQQDSVQYSVFSNKTWAAPKAMAGGHLTVSAPALTGGAGKAYLVFLNDSFKYEFAQFDGSAWSAPDAVGLPQQGGVVAAAMAFKTGKLSSAFVADDSTHGLMSIDNDGGWGDPVTIADTFNVAIPPTLVVPTSGPDLMVTAVRANQHVAFGTRKDGVWSSAVDVSNATTSDRVSLAAAYGLVAAAYRGPGGKVFVTVWSSLVGNWTIPATVGSPAAIAIGTPAIAPGLAGTWEVAWVAPDGSVYHSSLVDAVWSKPVLVGTNAVSVALIRGG